MARTGGQTGQEGGAAERVRTWLFAPADDAKKCRRAAQSGADQVIWDLEDAVAPADKEAARAALAQLLADARREGWRPWVRIGSPSTADGAEDLRLLGEERAFDRLVVPKADARSLAALASRTMRGEWLLIIESARGLWDLAHDRLALPPGVCGRLAFGALDYALDLGSEPAADGTELLHARSQIVWLSRALGLSAPVDSVHPSLRDPDGLWAAARQGYRLGFGGKLAIHPAQLEPIRRAFAPSAETVAWARRVLAAQADGRGAVQVDGAMVDRPVFERARAVVAAVEGEAPAQGAGGGPQQGGGAGC